MVKTTINVPDDIWKRFTMNVIQQWGGRKNSDVITDLIEDYNKKCEVTEGKKVKVLNKK